MMADGLEVCEGLAGPEQALAVAPSGAGVLLDASDRFGAGHSSAPLCEGLGWTPKSYRRESGLCPAI